VLEIDEIYGRCSLCAKDIGRCGTLMQQCQPCSTFGFVGAGGAVFTPIPVSEWYGRRVSPGRGQR